MKVEIPELALVALVGVSGSGKSTFAATHFRSTEVLSSDFCRGLVADDENAQDATKAAFDVLHYIAGKRLEAGRLTVVDATSVQPEARRPLVKLARHHDVLPVAIVFDLPEDVCATRNEQRADRDFGRHVIRRQRQQMRRSLRQLQREGFRRVWTLHSADEVDGAEVVREPMWTDRRDQHGPFDLIGDVHGCFDELAELLDRLGYKIDVAAVSAAAPDGRRAVFVGDLVDRGPKSPEVLELVMNMVEAGTAICVPGNHENKLLRALNGRSVRVSHGLEMTLEQLGTRPPAFVERVRRFIDGLVSHYVFDDGRLVVAHAGLPERLHNRASQRVRSFALYGDTTGETDEFGLPVRYPWANDYRGSAQVVYGHTPVPEAAWVNGTICIDTGCVFGGELTALRYPERELVSIPARTTYYEPARPLRPAVATGDRPASQLDIDDVSGKRVIDTRLKQRITIREENASAALEVMSRFALEPRWLVYLPPTMAPCATSEREGFLEYPTEAFAAYRRDGIRHVVCEEKHMGSRAVLVVCRDGEVAARRFGVGDGGSGVIYTRTGRAFFPEGELGEQLLQRVRTGLDSVGLWEELETDWLVLDCELLPWSVKAEELLRRQYAAVGTAGRQATAAAREALEAAVARGVDAAGLRDLYAQREEGIVGFVDAYRTYCWPVESVDDCRIAPFQILAGEGTLHAARDHRWQMETIGRLVDVDTATFQPTRWRSVDLDEPESEAAATAWWEDTTSAGGEGMVVKPLEAIVEGKRGLVQPGIKCRGREYLRIIYGPDYTEPANLYRLRNRGLGHKRSMAEREFALGIEALERFVDRQPLYRVHECVFGVLALESEPVDPRL